ncbi:MAG: DUF4296 domain-containing protein [Saprospiraceae bacterium]|nr:DUF4296 domain-containing protein [Saprospiraceae bacterium]MBK8484143.1 DUF4296 domain-containing protein [Saprospiraceae bacterium]MBK9221547.1 DUF4296 domain-containing protein [Saprospiraceae bacterium]MBK9721516.1 DUF4296 domain-containing protein [Saprospiraceae bacterium]MBK9728580.1 DUF4296 domain-containing protein [Saprospiraceae bacterium]
MRPTILFILVLLAYSCKHSKTIGTPPIEERTMIQIMTECYFLEAQFTDLNSHLKDSIIAVEFKNILQKHGVDETRYTEAQQYYNANEDALKKLEEGVKSSVNEASKHN